MKRTESKNHTNKRFIQQSCNQEPYEFTFIIGELYLFHSTKKHCPSRSSLWGVYDKTDDGVIYLESSTLDLIHFKIWHRLPDGYRYWRRATRGELRDYMYNLGHSDSHLQHIISPNKHQPKICAQSIFGHPRTRYSYPLDMRNGNV